MNSPVSWQGVDTDLSQYAAMEFLVRQLMARACHVALVQVQNVSNAGGVVPVGTVDILPLVNQIDGAGNAQPHGTVYGVPYFRLQGGANAIILDPQVGDIGVCVFADRDISSVKANSADIQDGPVPNPGVNPPSARRFDWADGLYFGGFLNGVPVQWIQFAAGGIRIHSPTLVKLDAPDIQLDAATIELIATDTITINATTAVNSTTPLFTIHGALTVTQGITGGAGASITGAVTATGEGTFNGGHTVSAHTHTQPNDSHGDSEAATNSPTG